MQMITTVTQKGQVTIPLAIRKQLNIKTYGRVLVELVGDYVKIKPVEDIVDLAGTFKTKVRKSPVVARAEMEKNYDRF